MVVFTCGNCGDSIKKPGVEKHFGRCRAPPHLTCVDCLKDFRGSDYVAHIKCLTEEERYAAKGFIAKPSSNKGERKQQGWFEAVQNILNGDRKLNHDEREFLKVLSNHENLPRKKVKFINFINNAHKAYARKGNLVERVWSIVEEAGKSAIEIKKEPADSNDSKIAEEQSNGENKKRKVSEGEPTDTPTKKKKKSKNSENGVPEKTEIKNDDEIQPGTEKKRKKKSKESKDEQENNVNGDEGTDNPKKNKSKIAEPEDQLEGSLIENGDEADTDIAKVLKMTDVSLYKVNKLVEKYCIAQSKDVKETQKRIRISCVSVKD